MSMVAAPQIPNGGAVDPAPPHDKEQSIDRPTPRPSKPRSGVIKRSKPEEGGHPVLHYLEGQPLHWKDLEEGCDLAEVHVSKDSMSNTNSLVRSRQLWGNEVYTQDSDLLAVLMHQGFFNQQVPFAIQEVCCLLRLQPPAASYASCARNGIRSRAWGPSSGSSFKVERCWAVGTHGATVDLAPSLDGATSVVPTFAPTLMERPMHTRAASSAPERRQRSVQEVTVQFNLCMEPWLKYAMHLVADQGLQRSQWTSARLLREALYVETNRARYELSWQDPAPKDAAKPAPPANGNVPAQEKYRWAKCREPLPQAMMRKLGIPLPAFALEEVETDLQWETLKWGPAGMYLHGKLFHIQRLHFTARRSPQGADRMHSQPPSQCPAPSADRSLGHQL